MKKMNYLLGALVVAGALFTSCSDDDNTETVTIEGTYNLKEVNTEEATDFDGDGTAHVNQMDESGCYDNGKITLNSDNTFTYVVTGILVDVSSGSSGCATDFQASGTWEASGTGNNATISAAYEDQTGTDRVITLQKQGNKLTYANDNILSQYPDRNDSGDAVYTSGSVTYVFEK